MRSEKFYIEFILLTIAALLAANLWVRVVSKWLDTLDSGVSTDLLVAIIVTLVSFGIMHMLFSYGGDTVKEGMKFELSPKEEFFEEEKEKLLKRTS